MVSTADVATWAIMSVKLVWDAPVETRAVDIPFEFKDVPLP